MSQPAATPPSTAPLLVPQLILLPGRTLLRLAGPEAKSFLQGLISNDTARITPDQAIYAALLSPQGKFLYELFVAEWQENLWLDVATASAPELARKLLLYRMRSKVSIDLLPDWRGFALIGAETDRKPAPAGGFSFADPRLAAMGQRLWLPPEAPLPDLPPGNFSAYEALRLDLGLPDGGQDIEIDKGLLLEHHFEALHGVDFKKGCYVGQELTARTKYRGLVKKQLFQVQGDADLPPPGSPILLGEQEAGWMRSSLGRQGLALLRLDATAKAAAGDGSLTCNGVTLTARLPDYAQMAKE